MLNSRAAIQDADKISLTKNSLQFDKQTHTNSEHYTQTVVDYIPTHTISTGLYYTGETEQSKCSVRQTKHISPVLATDTITSQ